MRDSYERDRLPEGATARARGMRRRMNGAEQRLWGELRKLDVNFRRQAPIGRYFADFPAHGRKLVIEVDGGVHERIADVAARDAERQRWLEGEGYRVLRFSDRQVYDDVHTVIDAIREALLLDGGGLGGGVAAEVKLAVPVGAGAQQSLERPLTAHTTIPGPSSIEEEGRAFLAAPTVETGGAHV
ncbi:endonuclease domain-containing protein [Phenylobacterium sp.]|uniref:endonuclease domain-containing protein n=1 Tax=Phenylobacterium sp. TaxID=1871053 RepID=UPI002BD7DC32|nr:endonuclease domain-containing protein [Phenylobacterium sp.]HVI32831.1 endonuclease domain-containing protein [Phenylobacterium sp.]